MSFFMRNKKITVRETFSGEEIALLDIFWLFYSRKIYLAVSVVVFLIIGVIVANTTPVEYEATVEILSEGGDDGSVGGLSDLIGLAGVRTNRKSSGGGSGGLDSDMYPQILRSSPFLLELMDEEFQFGRKRKMSLYEFFLQPEPKHFFAAAADYLKDFPLNVKILLGLAKKKKQVTPKHIRKKMEDYPSVLILSGEEKKVMAQLKRRISIASDGRIISLTVKMPDRNVAAQLNTIVIEKLITYLSNYKTEKLRLDLDFISERKAEAETEYLKAQKELATFRDSNQGRMTKLAESREQYLTFEYNLAFNIYNTLSNQLEQAQIQVKKETPLFSEFEPVSIPGSPSEPKASKIIILYTGVGAVVGFFILVLMLFVSYFKELTISKTN
ncbi:putative Chain length determinant protein [Imperialibacter sp. EC-SDR9]|nr:putative Chain length determinant protein [Imperialibacter sp. 89]CAD5296481.1 putative Chain length determinant protein [Imperialibacter sp. 75]VVT33804.1 putative Chain length determinant protein [Imperialibacter sp. EC-SDR9]